MGTGDQVRQFLVWIVAEQEAISGKGSGGRWTDDGVWAQYHRWAKLHSVVTVPRCLFLQTLAAQTPQVTRKRERLLDGAGNGRYLPTGSPMRETVYRIYPPKKQTLPGKVPLGPTVPKHDLGPPPMARQPDQQLAQPMKRAA